MTTHTRAAQLDAPPETWPLSLYVGRHQGKRVVYEYDRHSHERKAKLTYPVDAGRSFYTEGDVICIAPIEPRFFKILHPELFEGTDEHESIMSQLAFGFLLGPPPDYIKGFKILRITASSASKGEGSLDLQPLWLMDDETHIEIGNPVHKSSMRDASHLLNTTMSARAAAILGRGFAKTFSLVFGGAAKSAASRLVGRKVVALSLREALRRTGKRALLRRIWLGLKKDVVKNGASATLAFVTTFVQELKTRRTSTTCCRGPRPTRQSGSVSSATSSDRPQPRPWPLSSTPC